MKNDTQEGKRDFSINFNEGGGFITFAVNYLNLRFFLAFAIPYPWFGRYRDPTRYNPSPLYRWHIRHKTLQFVWYKKNENNKKL